MYHRSTSIIDGYKARSRSLRMYAKSDASQDKSHPNPCIWYVQSATLPKKRQRSPLGRHNRPREITFPSAHHSPKTVNKNANEFVIGTVRLNSRISIVRSARIPQDHFHPSPRHHSLPPFIPLPPPLPPPLLPHPLAPPPPSHPIPLLPYQTDPTNPLTRLPNQQEKPHAPRHIHQQRHRIPRPPQQIQHRVPRPQHLPLDPALLRVDRGPRRGVEIHGRAPDERRGQAPGHAYEEEAEDVVEEGGGCGGGGGGGGVHFGWWMGRWVGEEEEGEGGVVRRVEGEIEG